MAGRGKASSEKSPRSPNPVSTAVDPFSRTTRPIAEKLGHFSVAPFFTTTEPPQLAAGPSTSVPSSTTISPVAPGHGYWSPITPLPDLAKDPLPSKDARSARGCRVTTRTFPSSLIGAALLMKLGSNDAIAPPTKTTSFVRPFA